MAIRLTIDMCIDVAVIRKGVKARVISPTFQQWKRAISIPVTTVVEFRQRTAMTPVTMLWIWYASFDNFVDIAPGVFYLLSKYRIGIFNNFSKTRMRMS